jgi:hypothetical protein
VNGNTLWKTTDTQVLDAIGPLTSKQEWYQTSSYTKCTNELLLLAGSPILPQPSKLNVSLAALSAQDGKIRWHAKRTSGHILLLDDFIYSFNEKLDYKTGLALGRLSPVTRCARPTATVDSIFMLPHLGVLSTVHEPAATEVFLKDCLVPLGTCVAPAGSGRPGEPCLEFRLARPDGRTQPGRLALGEMRRFALAAGETAALEVVPAKGFDAGAGRGRRLLRLPEGRQEDPLARAWPHLRPQRRAVRH